MVLEAVLIGAELRGDEWPMLDLDDPGFDLGLEHRAPLVGAAIVVEVEALDALKAVERHPLRQIASLVAEDRTDRERDRRPRAERRRPALSEVAGPPAPVPGLGGALPDRRRHQFPQPLIHRTADEVGSPPAGARAASIFLSSGAN